MESSLIKQFEEKFERSRYLQDTGIGDIHAEQGSFCDEYVKFLHDKCSERMDDINVKNELLRKAVILVGNPATNISGSVDVACRDWQEEYEDLTSK